MGETQTSWEYPPSPPCGAVQLHARRDENDDRVRTIQICNRCQAKRFGVFVKRAAADATGPVGEWQVFGECPLAKGGTP